MVIRIQKMEHLVWLILCSFSVYTDNVIASKDIPFSDKEQLFHKFLKSYKKSYVNSTYEYTKRMDIFMKNLELAERLNQRRTDNASALYGVTKFSDLSPKEFEENYLSGYVPVDLPKYQAESENQQLLYSSYGYKGKDLPKEVDWRKKGIVTQIRNQQHCGGCWAYSATEVIESAFAQKYSTLTDFSVQQIIDCSRRYKNLLNGCQGGLPCVAFSWLNETDTVLVPEVKYPTKNKDLPCKIQPKSATGVKVQAFACHNFTGQEENIVRHLANVGPLSVAVDARNWQNYQGGIIQYHCPSHLNHAVTIVGYDTSGHVPYYIVRNSWGTDWGHSGYGYLKIGVDICGIARSIAWVTDILQV